MKCERCGEPLIDGTPGFSHDGRRVCTRYGCQYVEELNARVAEGSYKILPIAAFKTKPGWPLLGTVYNKTLLDGVLTRPLPPEDVVE